MAGVDTNTGGVTAVEAWTGITVAARLVFTARAVVDSVTADIHRQTVAVAWTLEVGFWARRGIARLPSIRQWGYGKREQIFACG